MKIAITGGTGFIGGHLARHLASQGHHVVLIARGKDSRNPDLRNLPNSTFVPCGIDSAEALTTAFAGCDGVAHCAGINREHGDQTYQRVHVQGTANVIEAAQAAGVQKIAFVSFIRARPNCGSAYHESKWAAEELVRNSGLDYTILKEGITYGRGDHMLDHLHLALTRLPLFAFVGLKEKAIRPIAVADVVRILAASLVEGRLSRETVAVLGPEEMVLSTAVRRVGDVLGRKPLYFRLPVWCHRLLAYFWEAVMPIPLVSKAQVFMLAEGLTEPAPATPVLQGDLAPTQRFTVENIRAGLPA